MIIEDERLIGCLECAECFPNNLRLWGNICKHEKCVKGKIRGEEWIKTSRQTPTGEIILAATKGDGNIGPCLIEVLFYSCEMGFYYDVNGDKIPVGMIRYWMQIERPDLNSY